MGAVNAAVGHPATIVDALSRWAAHTPDAVALLAPGRGATTYRALGRAVGRLASDLRARGLGRNDGIALAFPDGPEVYVALLAAMTVGIAVPLPWPVADDERGALLATPRPRAMLAPQGSSLARRHGLPRLDWIGGGSGRPDDAEIRGPVVGDATLARAPRASDIALILHSSGSTGAPKRVPRTHGAIAAACAAMIAARGKTPADRCLSLARTAYSQGVNAWMYAIASGGSLIALPSIEAGRLAGWVAEFRPTYLSTGPTVLRGLAEGGEGFAAAVRDSPLHSIHSTAGPLPAAEHADLETRFGVPILNGYGLTEAPGIAGEPFPRNGSVPGAVGKPWREVKILDQALAAQDTGGIGEIVVRGATVFPGYLDDAAANAATFLPGGWFRTGDLGFLDDEGWLHLTGRMGDRINRGGEKISPDEVDQALLAHPAIVEAAAFGVPDDRLGEDIVAAVVLTRGVDVSAREVRHWLADRLSLHKVPRRIWFVLELPRTATGKVRRRQLARMWAETRS